MLPDVGVGLPQVHAGALPATKALESGKIPVRRIVPSRPGVPAIVRMEIRAPGSPACVLFRGSPMSVVGIAVATEDAKLVTAGWLAKRWRVTAWLRRLVLVGLITGLAIINAAGVYAQLVAAYVGERGAATSAVETRDTANCGPH